MDQETTTSASIYSTYKQRIDSMFNESRSQSSFGSKGCNYSYNTCLLISERHINISEEEQTKKCVNTVQAKIERICNEMAKTQRKKQKRKEISQTAFLQENYFTENRFSIEHLGSVQLVNKVTSLHELQEPLKNLYFDYCCKVESQHGNRWGKGTLEIAGNGLKIHYCNQGDGEIVQLNPFNTIAVWAAVKFVCRKKCVNHEGMGNNMEYAFYPLIADPEAVDQNSMFQALSYSEENIILSALEESGFRNSPLHHQSPMFIIVMRKMGVPRQLECHGFICACSEDAIVIAANLYQVLIKSVRNKHEVSNLNTCERKPNNAQNEIVRLSKGRLSISEQLSTSDTDIAEISKHTRTTPTQQDSKSEIQPESMDPSGKYEIDDFNERTNKIKSELPIRPPRQNKKLPLLTSKTQKDILPTGRSLTDCKPKDPKYNIDNQNEMVADCSINKSLQPSIDCLGAVWYRNENKHSIITPKHGNEFGDVLTRIAIPHSRSFLNANGPFSRYFRQQSDGEDINSCVKGTEISPLGLNELFAEFRLQEGLDSMDDILDAIIDAEGMSFNELKPLYKEFLFKLSVTLTKDELYQRSKFIMKRQKKKRKRRKSCCKHNKFTPGREGIRRAFRYSFSKFKNSKLNLTNLEFTSVLFPSGSIQNKRMTNPYTKSDSFECSFMESHLNVTTDSLSERNIGRPLLRNTANSNVTDSDYFCMATSSAATTQMYVKLTEQSYKNADRATRSSSGYTSCSECSYDTETCTCSSVERCYCSREKEEEYETPNSSDNQMSTAECACDSDSCFESDRCYCSGAKNNVMPKTFPNLNTNPNIREPSDLQNSSSFKSSYNKSECEELASTSDILKKTFFPVERFSNRITTTSQLKKLNTNESVIRKPQEKKLCYKCLGNVVENNSKNFYSSLGVSSLCGSNNDKFQNRMNVYACIQDSPQNLFLVKDKPVGFNCTCGNSRKNCELFENSGTQEDRLVLPNDKCEPRKQKVLVVSARDHTGRVIYLGATSRNGNCSMSEGKDIAPGKSDPGTSPICENIQGSSACEALSVKKSAEIAALFSHIKPGWTSDKYTYGESAKAKQSKLISRSEFANSVLSSGISYYLGSDLENSLGYFP
ncbi:hypothetical protein PR048_012570 [Dryococelus australis]|uniref:PID domain-containing protein n=1 Tax=Dryococelus australis TaxID=614101 RepID=A0ABQ9HQG5_9NEOP|nr:hypothetical protein PR048_012570 [Dryococelus australis]